MIKYGGADIFMIRETKVTNMQDFYAKSMWSNTSIGYSFSNSTCLSGGLITLWKEGVMEVLHSFIGDKYLG